MMQKQRILIRYTKNKNQGSSLVSVIVAFAILMMGLALFATALYAADSMTKTAREIKNNCSAAVEEFYVGNAEGGSSLDQDGATGTAMKFEMQAKEDTTAYSPFSMYGEAMSWEWQPEDESEDTFRIYYFQAP
ncbi:MAG: hypothetical protein EOM40_14465 [Clostridia bacterium]|nr:hypothetical protein [Clostridia bacterium]NCC44926.1 hypothetical protein [Clostridia bacterium]